MTRVMSRLLMASTLLISTHLNAEPVLMLAPPGGAVSGFPGEVVGWGFTLINNADYMVVVGADYLTLTPVGAFTDFISLSFVVVGPAPYAVPSWSQAFDRIAQTGIGQYQIDPLAPGGALSMGQIQVTYDLFSVSPNDPLFDPSLHGLSTGNTLDADASVYVVPLLVPEPATLGLLGVGLLALLGAVRHRKA